jgi:AcrR family transcriptional regulator
MAVRKPAEERKAEILDAALRLADELGPDRLSTEAIAREVGLTQPAIFRHFPTKQAIWEAVASTIATRMAEGWRTAMQRRDDPVERLRGLILSQLKLIQTTPAIPAILFSRELHAENDLLRKSVFYLLGRFHRALAEQVAQAQAAGGLRTDVDSEDAAFLLVGLVQGLAVRWSLSGRSFGLVEEGARLLDVQVGMFSAPNGSVRAKEAQK